MTWFAARVITTSAGATVEEPCDELCWICGTALESWPLQDKATMVRRVLSEHAMQEAFQKIRGGVKLAMEKLRRPQSHIFSNHGNGLRIIKREAGHMQLKQADVVQEETLGETLFFIHSTVSSYIDM